MKKTILFLAVLTALAILVISCAPQNGGALAGEAVKPTIQSCNQNQACKQAYNSCIQTQCAGRSGRELASCRSNCLTTATRSSQTTTTPPVATAPTTPPVSPTSPSPDNRSVPPFSTSMMRPCLNNQTCSTFFHACTQLSCTSLWQLQNTINTQWIQCRNDCYARASIGLQVPVYPCDDAHPSMCSTQETCIAAGNYWQELVSISDVPYYQCRDICPSWAPTDSRRVCLTQSGSTCYLSTQCQSGVCNVNEESGTGTCQ